jgi:hypothetical protein
MTGHWRRLGRLALDTSRAPWAVSHATLPIVEALADGCWAVYLSLRDGDGRSRVGRSRLTLTPSPALSPLEPDPVIDLGPLGAFDDSGVTTSCLVTAGRRRLLYYTGWTRGVTVPFYLAVGLAVSEDGGPFERSSLAPLLDRHRADPFLIASPFVRHENRLWRMWYISATRWVSTPDGPRHYYNIRYAESDDGVAWRRDGRISVDYAGDAEYAFARPCVLRDAEAFRMWYAIRGDRYRIGYAESPDGLTWSRQDDAGGLQAQGNDWDSEMVEYPWVFDAAGRRFMLYNGNGYGRTGVGMAVWEASGQ